MTVPMLWVLLANSGIFPPYTRPPQTMIDMVADALLIVAALGVVVFVTWYAWLHKWWERAAGRWMLAVFVSLELIILMVLVGRLTGGDYLGRDLFRLISYGSTAVSVWGLVGTMIRSYMRGHSRPLDVPERESARKITETER